MPYADIEKRRECARRSYWRNPEKHRERHRRYWWIHREEWIKKRRERDRRTILHLSNGKRIRGLNKRSRPDDCELCNEDHRMLYYHHWDDNNYNIGLWLCHRCHYKVEWIENGFKDFANKYHSLKKSVEADTFNPS